MTDVKDSAFTVQVTWYEKKIKEPSKGYYSNFTYDHWTSTEQSGKRATWSYYKGWRFDTQSESSTLNFRCVFDY